MEDQVTIDKAMEIGRKLIIQNFETTLKEWGVPFSSDQACEELAIRLLDSLDLITGKKNNSPIKGRHTNEKSS